MAIGAMGTGNNGTMATFDTAALEAEIDALVYRLYGLTDKEIAAIGNRAT